jgi:hypothetical protein
MEQTESLRVAEQETTLAPSLLSVSLLQAVAVAPRYARQSAA